MKPDRNRRELGRWGEWVALRHVRKLGWDVVARNWRGYRGEVDLIAYDGPVLVFLEVKTRHVPAPIHPEAQVDARKEKRLDELAMEFLTRYEITDVPVRFDVIAIETKDQKDFELRHYRA